MIIEKKINIKLYNDCPIYIYIGDTFKEVKEYVEKKYKVEFRNQSVNVGALTSHLTHDKMKEERTIMLFSNNYSEYVIYHESLHAAWEVLREHGVIVDEDNHETLAYLQGNIALEVAAIFNKLNKKKNEQSRNDDSTDSVEAVKS
jgi:hypothetical protein